jgi:hypothetical protein
MAAARENRKRFVAPGQLIVAPDAVIGLVAGSASGAVQRGVFSVNIVFPARGVRCGLHYGVAGFAIVATFSRGPYILVAHETRSVRRRCRLFVMNAETFVMAGGRDIARVADGCE